MLKSGSLARRVTQNKLCTKYTKNIEIKSITKLENFQIV